MVVVGGSTCCGFTGTCPCPGCIIGLLGSIELGRETVDPGLGTVDPGLGTAEPGLVAVDVPLVEAVEAGVPTLAPPDLVVPPR